MADENHHHHEEPDEEPHADHWHHHRIWWVPVDIVVNVGKTIGHVVTGVGHTVAEGARDVVGTD